MTVAVGVSGSLPNGRTGWPTSPALGPRKIGDERISEVVVTTFKTMPAARHPLEHALKFN